MADTYSAGRWDLSMPIMGIQQYHEASEAIRAYTRYRPRIGLILGSGLGTLADAVAEADVIPFANIPHFPPATVPGHAGRLVIGWLAGQVVWVMAGRLHYYEGYTMRQVTLPVRAMQLLGVETLILTNAAGGLNSAFQVGDLMLITDHIGLVGMTGHNPLFGPNDEALGVRFPSMTGVYDPALCQLALRVAAEKAIPLRQGVYVHVAGPHYETPAEVRFLRAIGGDAVGMSTVPEAVVAHHGGLRVLAISGITNLAQVEAIDGVAATHEEVLAVGQSLVPRFTALIEGILSRWGNE